MKKSFITIIILLLILNIFLLSYTKAQEPSIPNVPIIGNNTKEKVEHFQGVIENLTNNDTRNQFFQNQQNKFLNNTLVKSFFKVFNKASPILSPIFRFTIGTNLEFSFLFLLTFIIWLMILFFFDDILDTFSTFSRTASFVISFCLVVILSIATNPGLPKLLAQLIIKSVILVITNTLVRAIAAIIIVVIFITLIGFLFTYRKKIKENKKKQEEKETKEKIKTASEKIDKVSKNIEGTLKSEE